MCHLRCIMYHTGRKWPTTRCPPWPPPRPAGAQRPRMAAAKTAMTIVALETVSALTTPGPALVARQQQRRHGEVLHLPRPPHRDPGDVADRDGAQVGLGEAARSVGAAACSPPAPTSAGSSSACAGGRAARRGGGFGAATQGDVVPGRRLLPRKINWLDCRAHISRPTWPASAAPCGGSCFA